MLRLSHGQTVTTLIDFRLRAEQRFTVFKAASSLHVTAASPTMIQLVRTPVESEHEFIRTPVGCLGGFEKQVGFDIF